jgi:hypothetical protein
MRMSVKDNIRHFALRNMTNISYEHKTFVIIVFWAIAKNMSTILLVMAGAFIGSLYGAKINVNMIASVAVFCCLAPFIFAGGTYLFFRIHKPRAIRKVEKEKENQNV